MSPACAPPAYRLSPQLEQSGGASGHASAEPRVPGADWMAPWPSFFLPFFLLGPQARYAEAKAAYEDKKRSAGGGGNEEEAGSAGGSDGGDSS